MTIKISNLEDCLEDLSDDEMQQISGGITLGIGTNLPSSTPSSGHILTDAAIGAGAAGLLATLGSRFALAATYVHG